MINKVNYFFALLISLLPLALITGPAIPDIIISLSGIFFLIYILINNSFMKIIQNRLVQISILFWIFLLFISFFAQNIDLAYKDSIIFIRYLMIPIILVFGLFNNIKFLKISLGIIFLSVLFVCVDCLYQFFNYHPEIGYGKDLLGFQPNWYGRLTGPFYQELIPGAYVSKFGLIGLIFIFLNFKDKKNQNIVSIIYLSLIGFIAFVSGERMAFSTFLLGIFFLLIFYKEKRKIFLLSFLFILLTSYTITKIHPSFNDYTIIESKASHLGLKIEKEYKCNKDKNCKKIIQLQPSFITVLKNFKESAYGEIYFLGAEMFKDHKLKGIGLNNFTYLCEKDIRYSNLMKDYICVSHPHNIYFQWIIETGLFGFFLFIIYLFYIYKYIKLNNFNNYSLISIATLIIMFWPIMSTGSLLKNWNGVSTFFIIGLCLLLNKFKKENQ